MSGVVHPVGPKPQSVYWRRRAVFLLVILLTLFVIGRTIFGGSDSNSTATPLVSSSPTVSQSVSESATPVASPSASVQSASSAPEPTDAVDPITLLSPSPVATKSQPADACTDAEIQVKISMPKKVVKVGAGSDLVMTVKNNSDRTCRRDVGSGANEVTIISGPAHVWSTDDCSPGSESNYVKLKPNQSWSVKVVWNGKISAPNCQVLSTAKYGAYWAHARNGAELSDGVRFVVQ